MDYKELLHKAKEGNLSEVQAYGLIKTLKSENAELKDKLNHYRDMSISYYEELAKAKDKVSRRNLQIKDLKIRVKPLEMLTQAQAERIKELET